MDTGTTVGLGMSGVGIAGAGWAGHSALRDSTELRRSLGETETAGRALLEHVSKVKKIEGFPKPSINPLAILKTPTALRDLANRVDVLYQHAQTSNKAGPLATQGIASFEAWDVAKRSLLRSALVADQGVRCAWAGAAVAIASALN